jgi:hypothetical protein
MGEMIIQTNSTNDNGSIQDGTIILNDSQVYCE